MSITILRTADAWWVRTPRGAARVDTDATTTGELLAEPHRLHTAISSRKTVDEATLDLISPVTAPCRVVAQMTNFTSHVKDSGLDPETIPLTFFRKTSGSISGPFDAIVQPGARPLPRLRGRDRPGHRPRAPGGHPGHRRQLDLVRRRPRGHQRRVGPRRPAAEDPVLRVQVLPDVHAGRTRARTPGPRRAQAVRRPAAAPVGQRRAAPGRGGRRRHDLPPAGGAAGVEPVPAARRRATCS